MLFNTNVSTDKYLHICHKIIFNLEVLTHLGTSAVCFVIIHWCISWKVSKHDSGIIAGIHTEFFTGATQA